MVSKAKTTDQITSATEIIEDTATVVDTPLVKGDDAGAALPHHNFLSRLYTGTGAFEVVGRRRLWYAISGAIVAITIVSIVLRGFTFGIDFKGGTTVSMPAAGQTGTVQVAQVKDAFRQTLGVDPESVVIVGSGAAATVQIRSATLSNDKMAKLRNALFDTFQPKGSDGKPSKQAISDSAVSETWGGQITKKAVIALVVFLVLVSLYITLRYERYMAISALTTMCFDLTVTAGVYSLVGFEVTPATVIGLLTILGFSLYDTVIVFDKVEENTHGFQHTTRRTFAEQANLAVNQTFMRSINTSLISVLPVSALIVVAVWLLGVGTLKDLALVQLVGIVVGTYSSIFFATPLLVSLRERTELVRTHTRRVIRRRNPDLRTVAEKHPDQDRAGDQVGAESANHEQQDRAAGSVAATAGAVPNKPAPGARPARRAGSRHARPTGKRNKRQPGDDAERTAR
jgi:preprotein translocase subunit SecF